MGLQMHIASKSHTATRDGWSGTELRDKIRNGDVGPQKLDQFFSEIAGDDAQFGNFQWDLAYFFARQKMIVKSSLNDLWTVIDGWANDATVRRRLPGYQGDGYSDNKSGTSDELNWMLSSGKILGDCNTWLENAGSGLQNAGEACKDACDLTSSTNGLCDYCGTGKCCKEGTSGSACNGNEGGDMRWICVTS